MTDRLIGKKESLICNGKIYSEEHKRKFDVKDDIFKIEKDFINDTRLVLTINRLPITDWFKEQFKKLRQNINESNQEQRKSKGFRL